MKDIALFYGSYTGVTRDIAKKIVGNLGADKVDLYDIGKDGEKITEYNILIVGTSTWSIGELQEDWDSFIPKLQKMDFKGKTVALFGTGDQVGYPDTFLDGMGMLYEIFKSHGANIIGFWPIEGYDFTSPLPLYDNENFVGLAIDEDNQPELTDERIKKWCDSIRPIIIQ
jgi:flavodoxin long chain